jgi:hypothetical protein
MILLTLTATINGEPAPIPSVQMVARLGAGETVARTMDLPVPPMVPPAVYELCITAESGEATDTDCATIEVLPAGGPKIGGSGEILRQNVPNPFNPATQISFELPVVADWTLGIYNLTGQLIESFNGKDVGRVMVEWDASGFPSGVYFYKLSTDAFTETKKMILMK